MIKEETQEMKAKVRLKGKLVEYIFISILLISTQIQSQNLVVIDSTKEYYCLSNKKSLLIINRKVFDSNKAVITKYDISSFDFFNLKGKNIVCSDSESKEIPCLIDFKNYLFIEDMKKIKRNKYKLRVYYCNIPTIFMVFEMDLLCRRKIRLKYLHTEI